MDRNVDFAAANAPGRVAAARIAAFEAASSAVVHADADPAPARMQLIAAQRLSMPARPSGSDRPAFPLELSLRNELGRRADYSRVKRRIKGWPGNGSRIIKLRRDRGFANTPTPVTKTGPMPRIMPEARYFSMPSTEVGAEVLRNLALNCWPWVRSFTQSPAAVIHSPAEIAAAWPTTVISSRWPRALTRMTQNPFSAFW